ncbi:MmcQ/YjbR family DNA-binding protein [Mesorhizobium sp.]|jgi:predicted DNA-binding protein (MmcQ/YjbR family)|uniref:MmcQ/YjbR family DNA-binding protein n=1 Tax=Mesorhizobium sp. TaxID=1871066 RepID=UPI000FE4199A|nr:MmcQ/YjbR family DNA-binding protein [Mesorhizobium sp.]RWH67888.1 MAG: MmcQ/YjbR family DNA-binding protein [Mesorhizobium sp.]RWL23576.1 MAG: MmcQ/YjbR family DNA-binding protein [Mesorhizobium sp.]RWL24543.1 MAG: MmcQ/YjbR family DNA-binding protein [Mesorhizobium sp.]RWL36136.1 MAG: MmcQ/YjbR family DNA-binding protein [Mesorhizobium sp.]RWL49570.1 MAG: MmcQ/YjbR family DNA-binding protein [Mesorhizobium sp.]
MKLDDYNGFCASLPATTHVVQWGGAHVWKVGGKVFAIGGWNEGGELFVTFKCSEMAYDVLKDQPGCRPAPYLASRGMKWIQRQTSQSMNDAALKDYLRESYRLVVLKLTRQARKQLGLAAD